MRLTSQSTLAEHPLKFTDCYFPDLILEHIELVR
jgi:hypothetical protein